MSAWLALLGAGLLEIAWALGLKYSDGLTRFWPTVATVAAIALSFALMALAFWVKTACASLRISFLS